MGEDKWDQDRVRREWTALEKEVMEVEITQRPATIQCWNCGAEGLIE